MRLNEKLYNLRLIKTKINSIIIGNPGQSYSGTLVLIEQGAIMTGSLQTQFRTSQIKDGKILRYFQNDNLYSIVDAVPAAGIVRQRFRRDFSKCGVGLC